MVKVSYHCDVCDRVLEVEKKNTPLGEIEVVKTFRTKEWNTSTILPHLCESCALRIDNQLLETKLNCLKGCVKNKSRV